MQMVIRIPALLLGSGRCEVALNGLWPHAEQHIDVRRHMEGVRHRRGELGVALSRG